MLLVVNNAEKGLCSLVSHIFGFVAGRVAFDCVGMVLVWYWHTVTCIVYAFPWSRVVIRSGNAFSDWL